MNLPQGVEPFCKESHVAIAKKIIRCKNDVLLGVPVRERLGMNPEFSWFLVLRNVYQVLTMNYESMLNGSKGLSNLPRFEYFCTRSVYIHTHTYIYV